MDRIGRDDVPYIAQAEALRVEWDGLVIATNGGPLMGATVHLVDRNTTTPVRAATTTDARGRWHFRTGPGRFDVMIIWGSTVTQRSVEPDVDSAEALRVQMVLDQVNDDWRCSQQQPRPAPRWRRLWWPWHRGGGVA